VSLAEAVNIVEDAHLYGAKFVYVVDSFHRGFIVSACKSNHFFWDIKQKAVFSREYS
jgi:hypothetical protein